MELSDTRPIVVFYHSKLAKAMLDFKCYLYTQINWDARVISIKDDLRIVYTSSSLLEIDNAKVDMSRRQTPYTLKGMSFREYLEYEGVLKMDAVPLDELLNSHDSIAMDIAVRTKVLVAFEAYLRTGVYPFYKDAGQNFLVRLIEVDTLRETFFIDQCASVGTVQMPPKGDFLVNGKYLFEVGGDNKSFDQIADIPDSCLAIDGIEIGYGARIPLWMFGLLY